jgi:hypothetical protein
MEQRRAGKAFLESGLRVPLEVAVPLSQSIEQLRGWLKTQQPLDPTVALMVRLKVLELERLLAGIQHHQFVPADEWQYAVCEIQVLTRWLTGSR